MLFTMQHKKKKLASAWQVFGLLKGEDKNNVGSGGLCETFSVQLCKDGHLLERVLLSVPSVSLLLSELTHPAPW